MVSTVPEVSLDFFLAQIADYRALSGQGTAAQTL